MLPGSVHRDGEAPDRAANRSRASLPSTAIRASRFSDADRRTRQTALLNLYELQHSLAAARTAARTVETQIAAIRKDVGKGPLDTLATEISRLTGDIDRELNAATGLSRAIEAVLGLPNRRSTPADRLDVRRRGEDHRGIEPPAANRRAVGVPGSDEAGIVAEAAGTDYRTAPPAGGVSARRRSSS